MDEQMEENSRNIVMKTLLFGLMIMESVSAFAQTRPDIVVENFEGNGYGKWTVTGEAFGTAPARGTLPNQMPVSGFRGRGLVNSFFRGDGTTGTLTSPPFRIERKFLAFLIGGGKSEQTVMNLLLDGKRVRTSTGPNDKPGGSERLNWQAWDVQELEGKTVQIQLVDNATGGWGHISADEIIMTDENPIQEIKTAPLYGETYRPQFHFTAERKWLNDPNGLVYYGGEYHLFFQHNPQSTEWGNMTWGHAISPNLIHWKQRQHALLPDNLGTMFSGSAVVDWNNTSGFGTPDSKEKPLVAIYTAAGGTSPESKGQPFTQCIAYSNDKGRTWTKYAGNPVLKHIAGENRDPKVVWHEPSRQWIMALYLQGNEFAFFASPNLKDWTLLHKMNVPGTDECPDFFEMPIEGKPNERKWVWTAANGKYLVGSFDGKIFTPETPLQQPDFGLNFYAVQSYSDIPAKDGRRIQIAWMRGGEYPQMPFNQQMSFPCEMTLRETPDGLRVFRLPVREIKTLQGKPHRWRNVNVSAGVNPLSELKGDLWDIQAEFELNGAEEVGFTVGGETVAYSVKDKKLSALGGSAPLEPENGRVKIRILADRTSLEVFGNDGRVSLSSCFVPRVREQALGIHAVGGTAKLLSLTIYPLRSAWDIGASGR
jgi:fructan beta-fructosidase